MDGIESKENEAGVEERREARSGAGEGKGGTEKGAAAWAEIVHSLGITPEPPPPPRPDSLFLTSKKKGGKNG